MAGVLMETIVNETIQNFRGHEFLEKSLNSRQSESIVNNGLSDRTTATTISNSVLDQIDGMASLMQEVEIGYYERTFWILLFSLMVLVAAGGNIIVIYIVSTNREMKSVTNYFLVNLSLADTMVSTLNVIFNFISMLNSHWPFGKIYCKISNFIAILSISASVFTLTAISCDRYNAIIYPLRPRMSRKHAIGWILLIWTLSSALALPNLIYSVVVEDRLVNENLALTCTMIWPDGRYPFSSYDHIYNIIILVVTYLVPILTMAILYYEVGKELWGYEAIGENIEKQRRAIMAKKKIVKMMIVVVIIFALCWLPYHGFFIINYYMPTIFADGPLLYQRCYLVIYWLAMSNSMYNPIIIYFMNPKFRHEFRRVLWLICCCRVYVPPMKSDSTNSHNININIQTNNNDANLGSNQATTVNFNARHVGETNGRHSSTLITNESDDESRDQANNLLNQPSKSSPSESLTIPIEVTITQLTGDHHDEHETMIGSNCGRQVGASNVTISSDTTDEAHEQEPFLGQQEQKAIGRSNITNLRWPLSGSSDKLAEVIEQQDNCDNNKRLSFSAPTKPANGTGAGGKVWI